MATNQDLPGFDKKRNILFSDRSSDEKMRETGELYLAEGRYYDALDFFERCGADDLVRQVAEEAMEDGDTPLYMRAKKVLDDRITIEEWERLAESAEKNELYSAARIAHLKAGNQEEARRVAAMMPGAQPDEPQASAEETDEELEEA